MAEYRNTERLLALADLIELQPHSKDAATDGDGFNMRAFSHPCGTPSCIGGFCYVQATGNQFPRYGKGDEHDRYAQSMSFAEIEREVVRVTADWLGLTEKEADALCYPPFGLSWERITPKQAAAILREIAAGKEFENCHELWDKVEEYQYEHSDEDKLF